MKKMFLALGLGLIGGAVGNYLDIPLGWLLGAIVANMAASMHNLPVAIPVPLRRVALAVLGVLIGSAFTPQLLTQANEWALTLGVMVVFVVLAAAWAYFYGRHVTHFDQRTALFAGIPGGLGEMIMLGWSMGADPRTTSLAQSARLLTIVVLVPVLLKVFADLDAESSTTTGRIAASALQLRDVAVLAASAGVAGLVARLVCAPAPFLVGPMLATATLYMTGFSASRLPAELIAFSQVVIGSGIGATFAGATVRELVRTFSLSIGLTLSLLAMVLAFAYGASLHTEFGFAALILAFTPGGIAEMGILALLLGIDPVFVSTHHTVRVMLIYLIVPIVARRWFRDSPRGRPS